MGESAKEKAARKILESGSPADPLDGFEYTGPGSESMPTVTIRGTDHLGNEVVETVKMPPKEALRDLLSAELGKTPKRGKSRLKKKS